ncbi:MAG: monovalent cation/H+ antiporter complex subunit F [Alphaproteobacteria bacterium]
MSGSVLLFPAIGAVGATAGLAAFRLVRSRTTPDRLLALQLLVAKVIAVLFLLSAESGVAALAETALVLALLGAVTAAVFAQGSGDGRP